MANMPVKLKYSDTQVTASTPEQLREAGSGAAPAISRSTSVTLSSLKGLARPKSLGRRNTVATKALASYAEQVEQAEQEEEEVLDDVRTQKQQEYDDDEDEEFDLEELLEDDGKDRLIEEDETFERLNCIKYVPQMFWRRGERERRQMRQGTSRGRDRSLRKRKRGVIPTSS